VGVGGLNPLNPPSGSSSGQRQSTNGLPARVSVGGDVTAVSFEVREEVPSLSDRTLRTSAAHTYTRCRVFPPILSQSTTESDIFFGDVSYCLFTKKKLTQHEIVFFWICAVAKSNIFS